MWLKDPKGNENIICTMVKYGETFSAHHTTLNTSYSKVKITNKNLKVGFGNKEYMGDFLSLLYVAM